MKRHDDSISDRLRRMAATDELSVGRGRAEQIAYRALARTSARPRLRSFAAAVAGSAFAIVSVTGLGAIADSAVPGDSLYVVDRAYEAVAGVIGRDGDRTQETLQEAITLAQRGSRDQAAIHVANELGSFILPDDNGNETAPVPGTEVTTTTEAEQSPSTTVTEAATAAATAEAATPPEQPTAPPSEVEPVSEANDPFLLALEYALRATEAAAGTDDESITAEADEAVRSVVKLAAGTAEEDSGTTSEQTAPSALSIPETTTTTTTVKERGNSGNAPGNSTSTTTTTSVPTDSEEQPPGDGDTAGDDSGGSQEDPGSSAGEDGGDPDPGPIILPIP